MVMSCVTFFVLQLGTLMLSSLFWFVSSHDEVAWATRPSLCTAGLSNDTNILITGHIANWTCMRLHRSVTRIASTGKVMCLGTPPGNNVDISGVHCSSVTSVLEEILSRSHAVNPQIPNPTKSAGDEASRSVHGQQYQQVSASPACVTVHVNFQGGWPHPLNDAYSLRTTLYVTACILALCVVGTIAGCIVVIDYFHHRTLVETVSAIFGHQYDGNQDAHQEDQQQEDDGSGAQQQVPLPAMMFPPFPLPVFVCGYLPFPPMPPCAPASSPTAAHDATSFGEEQFATNSVQHPEEGEQDS